MLKSRKANAVIVYQVDRLSRDIVDLLASVRDWIRGGIEVHTCDIGRIQSELDIVLVIKGWQGSDERQKIRERTMRGIQQKARSGKVLGGGKPPYGYQFALEGKRVVGIVVDELEARIVRMIYRWYVHGAEDGMPINTWTIANRLTQMKVTAPDQRKTRRKRPSYVWGESTITRILKTEVYAGLWHYGKVAGKHGEGGTRPSSEWLSVNVPASVDRSLWQAAQERREFNKRMSRRHCTHNYLLRGMVKCAHCGGAVCGYFTRRRRCQVICVNGLESVRAG